MAFIAGSIFEKLNPEKKTNITVGISCAIGAFSYVAMYFIKSVISTVLVGSQFAPAVIANLTKLGTSSFNAVIATIFATILFPTFLKILKNSGVGK